MSGGFAKLLDLIIKAWDALKPYATVYAWGHGTLMRWGRFQRVLKPGFYWKWPIAEKTISVLTAISTMRGAAQTIGNRTFKWTIKYQVVDVQAYVCNIFEEENFLRDVVAGQVAEHISQGDKWENMLQRLRTEAAEGGFKILKLRLIDDTSEALALRMLSSHEEH